MKEYVAPSPLESPDSYRDGVRPEFELATFHPETCLIAERLKVPRIELCEDYSIGGVTPALEYFELARKLYSGTIFAMIRVRGGDFVYTQREMDEMLRSVEVLRAAGADGFVGGFLTEKKEVHTPFLKQFMEACGDSPVTFHRAFDSVPNQEEALKQIIEAGCNRILTSGGAKTAIEGKDQLAHLIYKANNRIIILPGGGIRSENVGELLKATGAKEIHSACVTEGYRSAVIVADETEMNSLMSQLVN